MYLIPFGIDQTIKVASKKDSKNGTIKLKKSVPKHNKPGNWMDGSIVEGMLILTDAVLLPRQAQAGLCADVA